MSSAGLEQKKRRKAFSSEEGLRFGFLYRFLYGDHIRDDVHVFKRVRFVRTGMVLVGVQLLLITAEFEHRVCEEHY